MRTFSNRSTKTTFTIRTTEVAEKLGLVHRSSPEEAPGTLTPREPSNRPEDGQDHQGDEPKGLYVISVAARLLAMHPQTLRKYERAGLIRPSRTMGMLRLYSEEDIVRLRLIKHLVDDLGLNIAGVNLALSLVNSLVVISSQLQNMGLQQVRDFLDRQLAEILELLDSRG